MANPSMIAATGAGPIPTEELETLRGSLRGQSCLKGDPGYDEARTIWNAMIDRRPALIVRCAGAADVIQAVRFRAQARAARRGARRRPQHRRQRRLRRRPDDRSVADEVGAGRPGGAARMGRAGRDAGRFRPRDAGVRPGDADRASTRRPASPG